MLVSLPARVGVLLPLGVLPALRAGAAALTALAPASRRGWRAQASSSLISMTVSAALWLRASTSRSAAMRSSTASVLEEPDSTNPVSNRCPVGGSPRRSIGTQPAPASRYTASAPRPPNLADHRSSTGKIAQYRLTLRETVTYGECAGYSEGDRCAHRLSGEFTSDLGRGYHWVRLQFQKVRGVGSEAGDRVTHELRRPGCDDLLVHEEEE